MQLVIEPGRSTTGYWRDLWLYRELLYFLAWRDLAVRYKQTAIGVAWVLIRPALTMLAFVGFRRLVGAPASTLPEPLLVFAAVLPWQFVASATLDASTSLVGNSNLLSKVYFPRLIIPLAAVGTAVVDFLLTGLLLALLMGWYRFAPSAAILALPLFALLATALAFGTGLLFAALTVRYRDFRYVVPFLLQIGLFISPVAFTTDALPDRWRWLYALNPMVGVIDGFRWSILGDTASWHPAELSISVAAAMGSVALGTWYFRRVERGFADVI